MRTLHLSPDRLRDKSALAILKNLFLTYGGIPGKPPATHKELAEWERLKVVPLVFGLQPADALMRKSPHQEVKPSIRSHLSALGLEPDEELVEILKRIADQYLKMRLNRGRKWGVSDIKAANLSLFSAIARRQGNRCAVCGIPFGDKERETLDHVLPWGLAGDPIDGSNWQLLCERCNVGKGSFLATLQSQEAFNWVYTCRLSDLSAANNRERRYVVLACAGRCSEAGCGATPRTARLRLVKTLESGLAVADNLQVVCELHVKTRALMD